MDTSAWLPAVLGIVGVLAGSLATGWAQSRTVATQVGEAERIRLDTLRRNAYADYIEVNTQTRMVLARLATELTHEGRTGLAQTLAEQLVSLAEARLSAEARVAVEGADQVVDAIEALRVTFSEDGADADEITPEMVAAANTRFRVESKRIQRLIREDLGTR